MGLIRVAAVKLSNLKSKAINNSFLQQSIGANIRKVQITGPNGILGNIGKSGEGSLLDSIFGFLGKAGSAIKGVADFSFSGIAGGIIAYQQYIWNFNWNISDAEINQNIQNSLENLAGTLGDTLGQALGFTVCGATAGAVIAVFNPSLAKAVLLELGQEALDDALGNIYDLAREATYAGANALFLKIFQSNRAFFSFYNNSVGTVLDQVIPGNLSWGNYVQQRREQNRHYSFADFVESSVDTISNPIQRSFFEEFFDAFGDGCQDAFYAVANQLDNYFASKELEQNLTGQTNLVTIKPSGDDNETVYIVGNKTNLVSTVSNTLANSRLNKPSIVPAGFMNKYTFVNQLQILYRGTSGNRSQYSVTVPHWNKSVNSSENIKFPNIRKGRWALVVTLDDNSKFQVNCASKGECTRVWNFFKKYIDTKVMNNPKLSYIENKNSNAQTVDTKAYRCILRDKKRGVLGQWNPQD
ncbi:hypothetical protein [Synechococcus sp. PCC 6312]|uniref:hypothetical protein n=1 Tax=Synechococcus sp. (strain ATCC 27167 / PCC 6312) TaxID=195253 RepID=UPI00029ED8AC|nr:hypothetical protein [Synechococcus sp. PCC 6312]AFY60525.1 hypothetical protein Syn6312_1353 [Synechococcus sp. PCC 6312]